MGKLQIFAIQLQDPHAVYFAGNWISGQLIVQLAEPMKMRGIHLAFKGEAYVHWTEQHSTGTGKDRRTETRHYSAREVYFNQSIILFGKPQGQMSGDNPTLPQGNYTYPFQFQIPENIPSSYEGTSYGVTAYVRYQLKGTIDKPWKFDHTTKRPFTVVGVLDLNRISNARSPQHMQDEKMICCCCCASGPITATVKLDRTGYVPGEYVILDGEIDNKSTRRIDGSKIILEARTTYHATCKTRRDTRKITELRRGGIEPGGADCFTGLSLQIPPLPPSYLEGCRIIDITYIMKLVVDPAGPATDLEVPTEIIIGTVPLQNINHYFAQNPYQNGSYTDTSAWMNAPPPVPTAPPSADMPSAPPPSYEECMWGRSDVRDEEDNEHTRGDFNWAPAYPYYSWGNHPTDPPGGYAPPPGGFAPPPAGYAPPPAGYAPPPAGYAPPPGGFAPPLGGAQPPAYAPPGGSAPYPPSGYPPNPAYPPMYPPAGQPPPYDGKSGGTYN